MTRGSTPKEAQPKAAPEPKAVTEPKAATEPKAVTAPRPTTPGVQKLPADGPGARLPGASVVDPTLLRGIVEKLNELGYTKDLGTYKAIAQLLVDTFFGGSLELAQDAKKHRTFRALADVKGLTVPYKTLTECVDVLRQVHELGALGERLMFTHHLALLPVKDPALKKQLAAQAVAEKLSVAKLRAAVAVANGEAPRGRKPTPSVVHALDKACDALDEAGDLAVSDEALAKVDPEALESRAERARAGIRKLEELLDRIDAVVARGRG